MIRKIIKIDEELCNGCGLCVSACHEAAIGLVDGKAKLLRDDYCDGLGNCLPVCPANAISFEEREALAYNEEEVLKNQQKLQHQQQYPYQQLHQHPQQLQGGCPGSRVMNLQREETAVNANARMEQASTPSMLRQWPVQIQLLPPNAPYFKNADLLIAADCTAYAFGAFHQFMKNKITLIGCPKLDDVDYSVKLGQILGMNKIESVTVIRMEVPCCGGIVHATKTAMANSGQIIPLRIVTIGTDGTILEDK